MHQHHRVGLDVLVHLVRNLSREQFQLIVNFLNGFNYFCVELKSAAFCPLKLNSFQQSPQTQLLLSSNYLFVFDYVYDAANHVLDT